jgi:sugar (pentulose or hexulose) kinase
MPVLLITHVQGDTLKCALYLQSWRVDQSRWYLWSVVSISTGIFTTYSFMLVNSGPLVIIGQLFVSLVFAALASRIPLAGYSYQWTSRLANPKIGWISFIFLIVDVVAVDYAVASTVLPSLFRYTESFQNAWLATAIVVFVPALAGLAAPHWDTYARGMIVGITRGTTCAHLVRATLEGIAFSTRDVLEAMAKDTDRPIRSIKVDGGASANGFLMQALADISGIEVRVAAIRETTALGAAFMAGLGVGLWNDQGETSDLWRESASYVPRKDRDVEVLYQLWLRAVERAKGWAVPVSLSA